MKLTESKLFYWGFVKRFICPSHPLYGGKIWVYELGDIITLNEDFSYNPLNIRHYIETEERLKSLYFGLTGKHFEQ
jgi:hypothetical protein